MNAAGEALMAFRAERGMSRADLASFLSVSRMAVYRWEKGGRMIELDLLPRVRERTGIPANVLRPDLAPLFIEAVE